MEKMKLFAKADCPACGGRGTVYDSVPVPFGVGNCQMETDCECPYEDVDEDIMDKIDNNEIVVEVCPAPAWEEAQEKLAEDDRYDEPQPFRFERD